jgi:hypothetical protein
LQRLNINNEMWGEGIRCDWLFRGHLDAAWRLRPSAWREYEKDEDNVLLPLERKVRELMQSSGIDFDESKYALNPKIGAQLQAISDFADICTRTKLFIPSHGHFDLESFAQDSVDRTDSFLYSNYPREAAAYAQHHGIPTALLDWTTDPLVAAYFSAESAYGHAKEIAVWALDWSKVKEKVRKLKSVQVQHYLFDFLHAQSGVFLLYEDGVDRFRTHGFWPALEDILNERIKDFPQTVLRKFTLPVECREEVLVKLYRLGKSGAQIRPTYEFAAKTAKEKWRWSSRSSSGS